MWKKFLKKIRSDSADSILITSIICAPLMGMFFCIATDSAKNVYTGNYYNTIAQASVETAVKTIDAKGNLVPAYTIPAFIKEFDNQIEGTAQKNTHTAEANSYTGRCTTAEIHGVERKLPYYEVSLSTDRGVKNKASSKTWKIEAGSKPSYAVPAGSPNAFRVVSADVYTSSSNIALGMFGRPCQLFKTSVSAIAFGDNVDLKEKPAPAPSPTPTPPKGAGPSILPPGYVPGG